MGNEAESEREEARHAGRGLVWVASGKIVFIVTAYAVALSLPRLFGSEQVFGLFSVAFGAASILNNVLVASTVQTVSKLVSEDETRAGQTLRQGLLLQLFVGTALGGGLALAAPLIAEQALLDAALTPLIRIAGGVVFAYALYATLVGSLNGRRRFSHQARLDMTFSVLRTAGLVTPRKDGRRRLYRVAPEPLREVYDWVQHYERFWDDKLDALGRFLDAEVT